MSIRQCTLVVSSCDAYEDLWPIFFRILICTWKNIECSIVLNTESKSYSHPNLNIKTFNMYKPGEKVAWTRRLRETLQKIDSEFVIVLLDDFFMRGQVDVKRIERCIDYMQENKRIASFCFMETFTKNIKDDKYDQFEKRPWIAKYKLNCQAALWRRKTLIKYLKKEENPWEWETMGNWRTYRHPYDIFYSQIPNGNYIFPYIYKANGINWGGLAVYRGKWYLPYVDKLFENYGIKVDYNQRGTIVDADFIPHIRKQKEDYSGVKKRLYWLIQIYIYIRYFIDFLMNIRHFI